MTRIMDTLHRLVLHIPIVTTVLSAFFAWVVLRRYFAHRDRLHLLWWGIGLVTYAVGTLAESLTTIFGWSAGVFRLWYIAGAFLGGYPLAQGTIYLLMSRRFAHVSAIVVNAVILFGSAAVLLSPLHLEAAEAHRLHGSVLVWSWVRLLTPFINLYSLFFLAGGAVYSAMRMRADADARERYVGNILIAIGAVLPGIGGTFTRMGYMEALYVTELTGLLFIYAGYRMCVRSRAERGAETSGRQQPGAAADESKGAALT